MPTCHKCLTDFPVSVKIEGKTRILSSRKYCLQCSPFKSNNRLKLCQKEKKNTECASCKKSTIRGRKLCTTCITNSRRFKIKKAAVEYLGSKCHECGWSGDLCGFDFHHRDSDSKEFNIGNSFYYSLIRIKQELDKCTLLCACCHRVKHSGCTEEIYAYALNKPIDFTKI